MRSNFGVGGGNLAHDVRGRRTASSKYRRVRRDVQTELPSAVLRFRARSCRDAGSLPAFRGEADEGRVPPADETGDQVDQLHRTWMMTPGSFLAAQAWA